jgi:TonB-linked SusC/RagA family outer membrane protein
MRLIPFKKNRLQDYILLPNFKNRILSFAKVATCTTISTLILQNHALAKAEKSSLNNLNSTAFYQIQQKITGQIFDEKNLPLPGATIKVLNTTIGAVSDGNGKFSINAKVGQVLVISYAGYQTKNVTIANVNSLKIILVESASKLDEVIVVGYGSQKKANITGAVSTVGAKDLEGRVTPNAVKAIQGMMPGVNVLPSDGKPTRGAVPAIRGISNSIGSGGSALVLIDGSEGSLDGVNPADIENISVLKDASSAAVYGARGAFGVILVTTKKAAQGDVKINYNGSYSINSRTVVPDVVTDGLQWTDGFIQSYRGALSVDPNGINNVFKFNWAWYDELKKRSADPSLGNVRVNSAGLYEYFGSTNWDDIIYKKHNGSQQHNLTLSGGNDKSSFYLSGRMFDQDGIYNAGNERFKQYNIRAKGDLKVKPWLTIGNNLDFSKTKYHQPMVMYDRQLIPRQVEQQAYPVTLEKNPDGTWTEAAVYIGWAGFAEGTSYQQNNDLTLRNRTNVDVSILPNVLMLRGDFTYSAERSSRDRVENMYKYYNGPDVSGTRNTFNSLENWGYDTDYIATNLTLDYTPKIGKDHYLKAMVGGNVEDKTYKTQQTYRRGLLYPELPSFSLMDGTYYTVAGGGYEWGFMGYFFRANYSYKNKYLLELSGRYDGTSKFPTNQQWGFFPSASVGWNINKEDFLKDANWLDQLKLRASVGSLGNGLVSPYSYLATLDISKTSTIINGSQQSYTTVPNLVPSGLTWEKSKTYNIGLDLNAFKNRLEFVFDYYQKFTTDMYTVGPNLPAALGSAAPKGNNADMKTKGWELSLGWNDSFTMAGKPFKWGVKALLWDNETTITKFYNETGLITSYYEGQKLGDIWGFKVEGLFKDQADINAHADQSFFNLSNTRISMPGDLKFADLNGDGKIDRGNQTLANHGDLEVIGNTTPRYQYGLNLNASWNNFGVSAFLQGVGKRNWYPAIESGYFWGQYNRPYGFMLKEHTGDNIWTEENQNVDAYWPRYRSYLANRTVGPMSLPNDRFLQDVSYLRVKNITVNYNLPNTVTKKLGLQALKFYVTGENLFTMSNLFKVTGNYDPEVIGAGDVDFRSTSGTDGDGFGYPMLKTITFGINLTL